MRRIILAWLITSAWQAIAASEAPNQSVPVVQGAISPASPEEEAFSRHIWDGRTQGCSSAFIRGAAGKVTLLTAAHCNDHGRIFVEMGNGSARDRRVEMRCTNHPDWRTGGAPAGALQNKSESHPDVAVCEGELAAFDGTPAWKALKELPCVSTDAPKPGEAMTILGRGKGAGDPPQLSHGEARVMSTGKPNAVEFYTVVDNARTVSGDSGGVVGKVLPGPDGKPVFQILGVTSGQRTKDSATDPIPEASVFTNLSHPPIAAFLRQAGVKFCGTGSVADAGMPFPSQIPSAPPPLGHVAPSAEIENLLRELTQLQVKLNDLIMRLSATPRHVPQPPGTRPHAATFDESPSH